MEPKHVLDKALQSISGDDNVAKYVRRRLRGLINELEAEYTYYSYRFTTSSGISDWSYLKVQKQTKSLTDPDQYDEVKSWIFEMSENSWFQYTSSGSIEINDCTKEIYEANRGF